MDLGLDLSAWAEAGWIGVLLALVLNTLAIVATWRITRHILRQVDHVSDNLKAIKELLERKDRNK